MPRKAPKRTLIHVTWRKTEKMWFVITTQKYVARKDKLEMFKRDEAETAASRHFTKKSAIVAAVLKAEMYEPASVYIHRRRSQIIDERSYGTDPRRTKG